MISLGTWVFSGDMWGSVKDDESISSVKAAFDQGINLIDTAPIYGFGKAEEVVGKAIQGKRDQIILATKCGLIKKNSKIIVDLSPKSIQMEIEASLKRLRVDCIDLYQCHWPDPNIPIEKTIDTLLKIKQQGKIRHIGFSNFGVALMKEARKLTEVVSLQNQYSLLERAVESDILPYCCEDKIGVITYGSLAGGILSGKYQEQPSFRNGDARDFFYKYYQGEPFLKTTEILEKLKGIGKPLNQIAINWVRQQRGITSVIVGCRNPKQVKDNAEAVTWELSSTELQQIRKICLR